MTFMTGEQLAKRVLEGDEDPKKVFRRVSQDHRNAVAMRQSFIDAYIEAALWSSTDDDGNPLDQAEGDLDPATKRKMEQDCIKFVDTNWEDIKDNLTQAGHDFWLTREGHGAGFWDGDWPDDVGDRLTEASKAFGEFPLYVGEDGNIYAYNL